MKKYKLQNNDYNNWKVIYVLGDVNLNSDYKIENNLMTIKCEDSYIHLLKKLVLAIIGIHTNLYKDDNKLILEGT